MEIKIHSAGYTYSYTSWLIRTFGSDVEKYHFPDNDLSTILLWK